MGCVKKPISFTLAVTTENVRVATKTTVKQYTLVPACYAPGKERCPDGRSEVDEQRGRSRIFEYDCRYSKCSSVKLLRALREMI